MKVSAIWSQIISIEMPSKIQHSVWWETFELRTLFLYTNGNSNDIIHIRMNSNFFMRNFENNTIENQWT